MIYEEIIVPRKKTEEELVKKVEETGKQLVLVNGPNKIGKNQLLISVRATLKEKKNYKVGALNRYKNPCAPKEKIEAAFSSYLMNDYILDCRKSVLDEYKGKEHTTLEALGKLDISNKLVLIINNVELAVDEENENGEAIFDKEKFLQDINALLKNSSVKIVLISRYSMEETFKGKLGERGDKKIACVSLGGFDEDEKKKFFDALSREKWYGDIKDVERERIREIFDKYAGSHPQLLNAIRQQLADLPEENRTAEALEQIIKIEIPKDSDSSIFRVYSRMDELLGKEKMVNTEKEKKLSYRDLYISCFSADGRDTGFSADVLKRYKEELFSKGYALKNKDGEYEAITPYMPIYLDKWRVEALEELMTGLDELEGGIRAVISEKLLNLMLLETGGDEEEAWELAEDKIAKLSFFNDNKKLFLMNNHVEHRLNGISKSMERESKVIAPLLVMSFEEYFAVLDKYWEFPHFPKRELTKGQYESLFDRLDKWRDKPILWQDETEKLNKLVTKIGAEKERRGAHINKLEEKLDELDKEYRDSLGVIIDKTNEKRLETARNTTDYEEKRRLIKIVYEETKEKEVRKATEELLKKSEELNNDAINNEINSIITKSVNPYFINKQGINIFDNFIDEEGKDKGKDHFQYLLDGVKNTCFRDNKAKQWISLKTLVTDDNYSEIEFQNKYRKLKDNMSKLTEVMELVCDYTTKKVNERRMSFNRARNVAKHRNNLDILDVRKYTGLLDDCSKMLEEIKFSTALPYYKISEHYAYFKVEQAMVAKCDRNPAGTKCKICGNFIAKEEYKELSPIPGVLTIEAEMLKCQGDLLLPVAWLEWNWNQDNQEYPYEVTLLEEWLHLIMREHGAVKFTYAGSKEVEFEYGPNGKIKKYEGIISNELVLEHKEYIICGDIEVKGNVGTHFININSVIAADEVNSIESVKSVFVCQEVFEKIKKGLLIHNNKCYPAEVLSEHETVCKGKMYLVDAVTFDVSVFRLKVKKEIQHMKFKPDGTAVNLKEVFAYKGKLNVLVGDLTLTFDARYNSTESRSLRTDIEYAVNNELISCSESGGLVFWSIDLREDIPKEEIDAVKRNMEYVFFKGNSDSVQGTIQNRKDRGRIYSATVQTAPQVSDKYYKVTSIDWDDVQKQFNVTLGDLAEEIEQGKTYMVQFTTDVFSPDNNYNEGYFIVNGETARRSSKNPIAKNKDMEVETISWDNENRCWWVKDKKSGPTEEEIAAKKQKEEEIKKLKEKLQNTENTILKPETGGFYIFELDAKEKNKGTFINSENKVSAKAEATVPENNAKLNALNKKWVKVTNISSKGIHTIQKADELFGKFVSGVRNKAGENEKEVDEQLNVWLASVKGKGRELLGECSKTDLSLVDLKKELPKLIQSSLYQRFEVNAADEADEFKETLDGLSDTDKDKIFSTKSKIVSPTGLENLKSVFVAFKKSAGKEFDFLLWLYDKLTEDQMEWLKCCELPDPSMKALDAWVKWKVPEAELAFAKKCKLKNIKSPKDLTEWLNWVNQLPEEDRNYVLTFEAYDSLEVLKTLLKNKKNPPKDNGNTN